MYAKIPVQTDPTPLLQLSIDLWKTSTPNNCFIDRQNAPIPSVKVNSHVADGPPPIKHRSLEEHCTTMLHILQNAQ